MSTFFSIVSHTTTRFVEPNPSTNAFRPVYFELAFISNMRLGGMDIPPNRMFEMNASSKYTGLNAFVEGFGSTKRVVVWDTMLKKVDIPQTLVVFGHEMGHYVLLHIPKQIAIDSTLVLILLYAGFR